MARETYQIEKIEEFRTRKVFSLFPFIIVNLFEDSPATTFLWTGKWLKFVEIQEQKARERYLEFDDGWSYQFYWTRWKERYKFIKLINNN